MAEFLYILNTRAIEKLFGDFMLTAGVPKQINRKWLPSIGLKSSNDRAIISILRSLGFVGNDGAPTKLWNEYRNKSRSCAVASG